MMLLWMTLSALAAEPFALERATSFTLEQAEVWSYQQTPEPLSQGVLLQVRLPPEVLEPRAIGVPLLLLGDRALERLSWDDTTGCAILWGPAADLSTTPLWIGPDTLPEQLDAERTATLRAESLAQPRFAAADIVAAERRAGHTTRTVPSKSEVLGVAADWLEDCAPTQTEHIRSLREAAAPKHW